MRAIEIDTVIDERHEIHITLPPEVRTGAARVIVLYDDRLVVPQTSRQFGRYRGQIRMADDAVGADPTG